MHTHRRLFERIATLENLIAAAQAALRGKRMRMPGAGFLADFEKEVFRLHDELWAGGYRHGGYTYFTIYEPKERIVAAAPFRDRVVHHAIVRVIEPIFEKRFIEDSFACRRDKGTHASMRRAAEFARRFPCALKCDVRKYFPSIDHEVLVGLLQRVIGDERLMALIRSILDTHADGVRQEWPAGGDLLDVQVFKRGLPIGNLTSQFFANVYLNPLDHFVKHELRVKGYVRYMDDFLLFGEDRPTLKSHGNPMRILASPLEAALAGRVFCWPEARKSHRRCQRPRAAVLRADNALETAMVKTSVSVAPAPRVSAARHWISAVARGHPDHRAGQRCNRTGVFAVANSGARWPKTD